MKKRLTRTEKWTQGKPEIPAYLSAYIALYSNNAYKLKQTKRKTHFLDAQISDIKQWHSYYENFNSFFADTLHGICTSMRKFGIPLDSHAEEGLCNTIRNPSEKLKEEFKNISNKDLSQKAASLKPMACDFIRYFLLNDFEFDSEQKIEPQNELVFENQGLSFLFCVLVPCMLEFQASPHELYEKSLAGNYEALEKLVYLDKHIVTNPQIAPIWTKLASNPTSHHFQRVSKALSSKPNFKIDTRSTKATHAAIIELMFQFCNDQGIIDYKLHRGQLFDIFDNVARDLEGTPTDYDFPETPDGRDKIINREKKRLQAFFQSIGL